VRKMNDPNEEKRSVIAAIKQNIHLPPEQQQFWQLFVAYKANSEQIAQLKEIFGRFPSKIPEMLARHLGMSQKNKQITHNFIQSLGKQYQQAVRKPVTT
jgi:hypothetical protein